jgi:hypothetical protein
MVKLNSTNFIELEMCCGELLNEDEKAYLYPLLVNWSGSDVDAANWLRTEAISALGGQTGLEVCRSNNSEGFIHYIKHIELGGFA